MNGQIKVTGTYRNGHKSGVWKYYTEKGILLKVEDYK